MELVLDFGIVFSLVSFNDETEKTKIETQSLFKQESRSQKRAVINGKSESQTGSRICR